jgi:D-alanyl-D-alanine carboxypeptidase
MSPYKLISQDSLKIKINKLLLDSFSNINAQITIIKDGINTNYSIGLRDSFQIIDSNTIFNIGSTSKFITSYLVYNAIIDKKVDINSSVKSYLKDIKIDNKIKIIDLLQHKSGVSEIGYAENINNSFSNDTFYMTKKPLYGFVFMDSLSTYGQFNYCNSNYLILGNLLEKVYKKSFNDLVQSKIINKYSLKNFHSAYSKKIKNVAHPFYDGEDLFNQSCNNYYSKFCFSAGGLASNSEDLAKLMYSIILKNEKILKYYTFNIDSSSGYGLGIEEYGQNAYGHSGDNIGFTSRNYINLKDKFAIIILSNTSESTKINKLSRLILNLINNSQ